MNNDGIADILLNNPNQGWNNVHLLKSDGQLQESRALPAWRGWNIVGTADFGNDDKTDILVNNPTRNWHNIWHMNNTNFGASESFPTWQNWEVIV